MSINVDPWQGFRQECLKEGGRSKRGRGSVGPPPGGNKFRVLNLSA